MDPAFDVQDNLYGNVKLKYHSVIPDRPDTVVTIENAALYPVLVKSPKSSGGALKDNDIKVALSFESLAGIRPKLRDRLYPDASIPYFGGRSYTVLDGSPGLISQHYQLSARDLVIENSLSEPIDIWRARSTKDDAFRIERNYFPFALRITGKAQPGDTVVTADHGIPRLLGPWTVFMEYDPGVLIDDQVRLEDGSILEVEGTFDPASIDALPSLACVNRGAMWR